MWRRVVIIFLLSQIFHVQCLKKGKKSLLADLIQDVTLTVSPKCFQQFGELVANFSIDADSLAFQMLDSIPKIAPGMLHYNFADMGNFQECIKIKADSPSEGVILGKYCLGSLFPKKDTISQFNKTWLRTKGEKSIFAGNAMVAKIPFWALCLPSGCTTDDANVIGNFVFNTLLKSERIGVSFLEPLCQTLNDTKPELTTKAIVTIAFFALLAFVVLSSTLYDLYCVFYSKKQRSLMVKGFSVYTNGQKLFRMSSTSSDQLSCLNGLKCISMMWVVFVHHYQLTINSQVTNTKNVIEWADSLHSMLIYNGHLCVDTFLTIGGVLMAYVFMKSKAKNVPFNIFLYYIHRYLRLTVPLAMVVLIQTNLFEYLGSGPKWPVVTTIYQKDCEEYWWSTILYVHNYVNISHMCMKETWYLDIDMQLYLISPLIFFGLWRYPKTFLTLMCCCVVAVSGACFYIAWTNNLIAVLSNFYGNYRESMDKLYFLTHTRSSPWFIGVILGYLLFQIKQKNIKLRMNKVWVCFIWLLCLGIMSGCIFGGHDSLRTEEYNRWANALLIALVRPIWALAISWIILACTNNYGGAINWFLSLPIYQVLNRFTYSLYLVHVLVLLVITGNREWSDYFSDFNMIYEYWGTLCFSSAFAIILVFVAECPTTAIESKLLECLGRKRKSPKTDTIQKIDIA